MPAAAWSGRPDAMAAEKGKVVRDAFLLQARACDELGSPFTARVCRLLADRLTAGTAAGERALGWQGDPTNAGDNLPLRFCGALNHLAVTGRDAELASAYPPVNPEADDESIWRAIFGALERHPVETVRFLDSAPQTNEVRRSAALLPAWSWLADRFGLPLVVSEVGASAGLNLHAERYHLRTPGFSLGDTASQVTLSPDWKGESPPVEGPVVAERLGCDLSPLDTSTRPGRERLLAYVWPDQRDRVERIAAAIGLAARDGLLVERADAADWLERRLASPRTGAVHVVQHTIAWQYFPAAVKARGEALLAQAGGKATTDAPLARIAMEADGKGPGAGLSMTLWPGGWTFALGRADFHGRWVDWRNPQG